MKQKTRTLRAAALGLCALALAAVGAVAQRPVANPSATRSAPKRTTTAPAPTTVKAKYEGGVVGYNKSEGTLAFEDVNSRLLFRDKKGAELFSIPYANVLEAWPDTKSRASTTGRVLASTVPYGLGLPGLLVRSKSRYLTLRYQDKDTGTSGVTSFRLESKELLSSVLATLGEKAELTPRGDAYIRSKDTATTPASHP